MLKRIECVPNISEGRRLEVIASITEAIARVPEVLLLDQSSDTEHNRTVFTLVGSPAGLKAAVLALYEAALSLIDLRQHAGKHPRMGAVDVVPFIPIQNATLADCVALSRETAQAVAELFGVPIYLYADAAIRPERAVLANIRKGEFEGLAAKMANPAWKPDFGPNLPHVSAGASAMGARAFLIAYNLQLDTPDLKVAQAVAKAVRASSGGLMNVQAMGIFLADRNQAQVSMNLLDFAKTPIHRAQELVKSETARYGARVLSSEIIGLVPQAALLEAAAYYLQVENWNPSLVLENAIQQKEARQHSDTGQTVTQTTPGERLGQLPLPEFLSRLAGPQATPGGGSVSALAGALAASLVAMVSGLTVGRKGFEEVSEPLAQIGAQGRTIAETLTQAIDDDAQAYNGVMAAFGLPKAGEGQKAVRTAAIQAAMKRAADVPLTVANACLQAAEFALTVLEKGNPNASSDAAVALLLALAGSDGAILNVATNLDSIKDAAYVTPRKEEIARLTAHGDGLRTAMWDAVHARIHSLPSRH
jgi:glutamate formiminotransferase